MHLVLKSCTQLYFSFTNISIHLIILHPPRKTITITRYIIDTNIFNISSLSILRKKKKEKKISLLIHYFNFQLQDTPSPHHITRRTKDPIPFPNSHCSTNTPNGTKTLQIPSKGSSASMLVNSYRSVRTPWCIKGALNILRAITIQQTDLGRYVSKVTINTILS